MTDKTYNILVLCTGNSAVASWPKPSLTRRARAASMLTVPAAIRPAKSTHSPWNKWLPWGYPYRRSAITQREICPVWPGQPISAHWGFEDPAAVEGSDDIKRFAFEKVFRQIMTRVQLFVNLPLSLLDKTAIKHELDNIGHPRNKEE